VQIQADKPTLHLDFGVPRGGRVDVEVTAMTKRGRKVTRVVNVDPNKLSRRMLVVKVGSGAANERL
jgi:hypothetical protein